MPILFSMTNARPGSATLGSDPDPDEYLCRFKEHVKEHLQNAYEMEHSAVQSETNGSLTTSLPEDIFSLMDMQRKVLDGFLCATKLLKTRKGGSMLVEGLLSILTDLENTQKRNRLLRLSTLEEACAAANDFLRMSGMMEDFLRDLFRAYPFVEAAAEEWPAARVRRVAADLVLLFSQDAVLAAEQVQLFCMRSIHRSSIRGDLFSVSWEEDWTHNEVAVAMVHTFDDYLTDCRAYLATGFLYQKAIVVSAKAAVCCYVRCLIEKADAATRRRRNRDRVSAERNPFRSRKRALIRMQDDIDIIRDFFRDKVKDSPASLRIVASETFILSLIHECLCVTDLASLETFIVVIHKRTGADALVTRHFVGDLWLLVAHQSGKRQIDRALAVLGPDLRMVSDGMKQQSPANNSTEMSFACLSDMLRVMYEDRIAQGVLPICWPFLPKVHAAGNEVVAEKIRVFTRNIAELRWK